MLQLTGVGSASCMLAPHSAAPARCTLPIRWRAIYCPTHRSFWMAIPPRSTAWSAPGTKLLFPSPGAGSLFDPPFAGNGGDRESGGGGRTDFPGTADGTAGEGRASAERPTIIVQPTAVLTEQLMKSASESALPLAEKTVDLAIDNLRNEIYVSRASWNALFPR